MTSKITLSILIFCLSIVSTQAQDWPNLKKYQEANSSLEAPSEDLQRVVFMGNSITEGWSINAPDFFAGKPYINRGISGQTTPQMLIRFRQDVIDLEPVVVHILAGTNDIAGNTGPSTVEMIADNMFSMAEIAHANGIKVIIASVLPAYDYPWRKGLEPAPKIVALNKMLKEYCEAKGHTYLDYFTYLKDERNGMPKKYANDGVHPTALGYEVMGKLFEKTLAEVLK